MIPASAWVYTSSTDPCPDGRWKQQGALLYISVHGYISNYQASPSCPVARCQSVAKHTALDQKLLLLHLHGELVLLVEKIIRPGPPIIWHLILTPPSCLAGRCSSITTLAHLGVKVLHYGSVIGVYCEIGIF